MGRNRVVVGSWHFGRYRIWIEVDYVMEDPIEYGLKIVLDNSFLEKPENVVKCALLGIRSLARKDVDFNNITMEWEPTTEDTVLTLRAPVKENV